MNHRKTFNRITLVALNTIAVIFFMCSITAESLAENLLYTPVTPCRIVDTRKVAKPWVERYNSPANGSDRAVAMAVDGSGNVYVTGYSDGIGTSRDYATIKYDTAGNQLWVERYNSPANGSDRAVAMAVDGSGNVYVTGYSDGIGTSRDYATIKYDTAGNQLWVERYNGPANSDDEARAIAVDGSGNVYVTGFVDTDYFSRSDYGTIKYDTAGNQLWVERYNGPGGGRLVNEAHAIAVDGSGNVYVTGRSERIKSSGGHTEDYATIKYDTDGNQLWVERYNGPANGGNSARAIAVDGSGNVYVTGTSLGDIGTSRDYATIKYDTAGNQLWVERYNSPANGSDGAVAMAVDGSGNVYVTGRSERIKSSGGYTEDYATIKYDTDGNQLWVERYNGPANGGNSARAIAVDGSGNVYVTGTSWSGSGIFGDYATIKYDTDGNQLWVERYNGPANSDDEAMAIAVDGSGNVYVTGFVDGDYFLRSDYGTIKYDTDLAGGPISPGGKRSYNVWGVVAPQGGNPAGCPAPMGEPMAAHIKLVVANPTGKGNMQAFAVGGKTGANLGVNFADIGSNRANAGTVETATGAGPDISVASNYSSAHAVIDVLGYYYPDGDLLYTPVEPCRIADTRNSGGKIYANTERDFHVFGDGATIGAQGGSPFGCPAPMGEPLAVHINLVAAAPTCKGNLQAYPVGGTPGANLGVNFAAIGTNFANAGTVQTSLGAGPDITVTSRYSSAYTVIDVLGYYYPDGDFTYTPVTPCRIVDTRKTSAGMIGASTERDFHVFGDSSTISAQGGNSAGCPAPMGEPLAAHIKLVVANPTGRGNMQAFAVGGEPGANLGVNFADIGTNFANAGTVETATGAGPDIAVTARWSSTHAVIDVLGYYYSSP